MPDPSEDPRLVGGAIWEDEKRLQAVVVATPEGFVLATWPAERGLMTHILPDGRWQFPDVHDLADALTGWRFVGLAGEGADAARSAS